RYLFTKHGPMSTPAYDVVAFVKTRAESDRPDAQLLATPLSLATTNLKNVQLEREPGLQCIAYVLRPESEGSITITSADPDVPPAITPNYFAAPYDRKVGIGLFRAVRALFSTEPIASFVDHETQPGSTVADDDEDGMIDAALTSGYCGYHSVATV